MTPRIYSHRVELLIDETNGWEVADYVALALAAADQAGATLAEQDRIAEILSRAEDRADARADALLDSDALADDLTAADVPMLPARLATPPHPDALRLRLASHAAQDAQDAAKRARAASFSAWALTALLIVALAACSTTPEPGPDASTPDAALTTDASTLDAYDPFGDPPTALCSEVCPGELLTPWYSAANVYVWSYCRPSYRALHRSDGARVRRLPVTALPATPRTPTRMLAAAIVAVEGLTFETKTLDDGTTAYRWCCATCPRSGLWLTRPEVSRRNGTLHARWHAEGEP